MEKDILVHIWISAYMAALSGLCAHSQHDPMGSTNTAYQVADKAVADFQKRWAH